VDDTRLYRWVAALAWRLQSFLVNLALAMNRPATPSTRVREQRSGFWTAEAHRTMDSRSCRPVIDNASVIRHAISGEYPWRTGRLPPAFC